MVALLARKRRRLWLVAPTVGLSATLSTRNGAGYSGPPVGPRSHPLRRPKPPIPPRKRGPASKTTLPPYFYTPDRSTRKPEEEALFSRARRWWPGAEAFRHDFDVRRTESPRSQSCLSFASESVARGAVWLHCWVHDGSLHRHVHGSFERANDCNDGGLRSRKGRRDGGVTGAASPVWARAAVHEPRFERPALIGVQLAGPGAREDEHEIVLERAAPDRRHCTRGRARGPAGMRACTSETRNAPFLGKRVDPGLRLGEAEPAGLRREANRHAGQRARIRRGVGPRKGPGTYQSVRR